jgi:3-oxoacyl-ACP reductase-like protein
MKHTTILSLSLFTLVSAATIHAQAPAAPGGAPAAPAAPGAPAAPASTAPAATAAPANAKPLSSNDTRALTQMTAAMQFHIRMGEIGKSKGRKDLPEAETFGTAVHKETVDLWTPLMTMTSERKVDSKYITAQLDKNDKAAIDKLSKVKEAKWYPEYLELLAKQGKRNTTKMEALTKSISDPDLKARAEAVTKVMAGQTERATAALAEAKAKK